MWRLIPIVSTSIRWRFQRNQSTFSFHSGYFRPYAKADFRERSKIIRWKNQDLRGSRSNFETMSVQISVSYRNPIISSLKWFRKYAQDFLRIVLIRKPIINESIWSKILRIIERELFLVLTRKVDKENKTKFVTHMTSNDEYVQRRFWDSPWYCRSMRLRVSMKTSRWKIMLSESRIKSSSSFDG